MTQILLWHVHGSWATSFVQGPHRYVVPVNAQRDEDGRGRAQTWEWPDSVVESIADELRRVGFDLVLLQRPHEAALLKEWTGMEAGIDVPALYVEHNTPPAPGARHPLADQTRIPIVHVTPFNRRAWDCGSARTLVVEHGIVDPGHLYTGESPRAAVVMNDPVRRRSALGTDIVAEIAKTEPLDVFGMRVQQLDETGEMAQGALFEDLPQAAMHRAIARRRVYLHTARWTSLGLSLIEAMQLGMPIVALSATETPRSVTPEAGVVSADVDELRFAVRRFINEPMLAQHAGRAAREAALERFGLHRFLADWNVLLEETVGVGAT